MLSLDGYAAPAGRHLLALRVRAQNVDAFFRSLSLVLEVGSARLEPVPASVLDPAGHGLYCDAENVAVPGDCTVVFEIDAVSEPNEGRLFYRGGSTVRLWRSGTVDGVVAFPVPTHVGTISPHVSFHPRRALLEILLGAPGYHWEICVGFDVLFHGATGLSVQDVVDNVEVEFDCDERKRARRSVVTCDGSDALIPGATSGCSGCFGISLSTQAKYVRLEQARLVLPGPVDIRSPLFPLPWPPDLPLDLVGRSLDLCS